ncbi:MAG: TolB family protein [Pirellulales bacterium]
MKARRLWIVATALTIALAGAAWALFRPAPGIPDQFAEVGRPPRIDPDYSDSTVPPNLAPLNFVVKEPGIEYRARISGTAGEAFTVTGQGAKIEIPPDPWRDLIELNRGKSIRFEVFARDAEGRWRRFAPVSNQIANDDIDSTLVYRSLKPLHNTFKNMGTYQRDLGSWDVSPVLESKYPTTRCVNCHTFANNRPDHMLLHTRGRDGLAMLLVADGQVHKVDTRTKALPGPASYSSWHPSGRLVAFSINSLVLLHHATGDNRDVFDYNSDLGIYDVQKSRVSTAPAISNPDRLETFPAWSPDGRFLYFCSAARDWPADMKDKGVLPNNYNQVRYDLVRVGYDLATGAWSQVETVLSARETGLSINEPRISPDGRFLLFSMAEYGSFPVYQRSSDLYMMDLATRRHWKLAINSDRSDSWHSWSSNSRWIAFASKRRDGLFGRVYLSYIDAGGNAHKPILLPQRDPAFYDSCLQNFNVPELIASPVAVPQQDFLDALRSSGRQEQGPGVGTTEGG